MFEAANPKKILDLIDEKKTNIETILPKLLAKQNRKKSLVSVFVGLNGRKMIFEDKLKHFEFVKMPFSKTMIGTKYCYSSMIVEKLNCVFVYKLVGGCNRAMLSHGLAREFFSPARDNVPPPNPK